jgi:acyl carrier protein/glycine/D-amino acid oxidase-like deaminating enzyme
VLVAPGTIPKTTSGKLQRAACRQRWLDRAIEPLRVAERAASAPRLPGVGAGATGPSLRDQLDAVHPDERLPWLLDVVQHLALEAQLIPAGTTITPDDFLPSLGLDSLASAELLVALEDAFGQPLPPALFVEHPSFRSVAARVLRELGVSFGGEGAPASAATSAPALPFRSPHRSMAPARTRVAVVGGGFAGLVSALELARLGYREVVVFESATRLRAEGAAAETVETDPWLVSDNHRVVLDLLADLELPLTPTRPAFFHFTEEHGLEEGPAAAPGARAIRALLKAAKLPVDPALPFPSLLDLDETLGQFLERNKLRSLHPHIWYSWAGQGHGFDLGVPVRHVLAHLQLAAGGHAGAHVPGGRPALEAALASHLETKWGVPIEANAPVALVQGDEAGVEVTRGDLRQRFDEVILSVPPPALRQLLDERDPLRPLLEPFGHVAVRRQTFRAEGLPRDATVFAPEHARSPGALVSLHADPHREGWFVSTQYRAKSPLAATDPSAAPADELLPNDLLERELTRAVKAMGGSLVTLGAARDEARFPHAADQPVALLRRVEALQGTRHLWTTGSWLSLDTPEGVARHARHLVQTAFDPQTSAGDPSSASTLDETNS